MKNEIKKRGGRPRSRKKQSYTAKFIAVNRNYFGNGVHPDWAKIKEVR